MIQTLEAYQGQPIASIELAGRPDVKQEEFAPLFLQHKGDAFDRQKVEQTVEAIKNTGRFQDVQLRVIPDVSGVRILLVLQPGLYFALYEFSGTRNFPYSRLLQVSNYPPEGPYNDRDVKSAVESLTKFFQQSGYFQAGVTSHIAPDPQHGIVNVHFDVTLGPRARFGTVVLEGASPEQTERLQRKLRSTMARLRGSSIRSGKAYSLRTVQNATQYMQNALIKQDLLGAKVEMIGAEYDAATNRADISFHVTEGPVTHVRVVGARVHRRTQRRLLPVFQNVGVDDELIQEGRRNLISHFQAKGFFEADVSTDVSHQDKAQTIEYKIDRGARHKVASVSIDGNETLGDDQLYGYIRVKRKAFFSRGAYSEKLLRTSARNLEAVYRSEGFSEAKVTPKVEGRGGNIDVTFLVNEGPRDMVHQLLITGNDTMPLAQLLPKGTRLTAGQPYSQRMADEDRQAITVKYLESGYLMSSFRAVLKAMPEDKHSLIVTYEIREGPRVNISSIITLGRDHSKQLLIDRNAKFRLNAPLTTGDMLSAESRLYTSGVFDWAEVTPRRPITTQTEEDVVVKVHESKRNTLVYGFGFEVVKRGGSLPSGTVAVPGLPPVGVGSNFVTSERTFWGPRGNIEYTRRNIFGLAETLTVGSLAGRLVQRATVNFHNPSFFGTSFNSNLSASYEHNSENPVYTDRIATAAFQLGKPLNSRRTQNLFLRYSFSHTQITDLLIPDLVPPDDRDVRLSTLSATYAHDTRDNALDAHRGQYHSVEIDLNPQVLGSSVSFAKLLTQAAYFKKVPGNIIWANSLRLGFDKAFAGSHVPLSQQFFSGGGSTLRGFPLNGAGPQEVIQACGKPEDPSTCSPLTVPRGGRQLVILNSEFRIPLPIYKGLGLVAFYDGGNVFPAIGFHGQYTNTVGGGLRYATPVGPIRFDFGHNLNSPKGISDNQYFITLGQAF